MRELYELRDRLIDELKAYNSRELGSNTLDTIDTLAHATKNLTKVIESCEEDHSYYSYRRRDSMGRYARGGGLKDELRALADETRDEHAKQEIMKLISHIE